MQNHEADIILTGGTIITMNPEQPEAEALAIRGNRIVFVGNADEVKTFQGKGTEVFDLAGAFAYPGFVDAHAHLYNLGRLLNELNLTGTASINEIQTKIVEYARNQEPDEWITGRGWDQNDWEVKQFPTLSDMPDIPQPVYVRRIDGHAAWVNRRALEIAGITKDTPDPDGGRILRDDDGNPTGVLVDNAANLIRKHIPDPTIEEIKQWIRDAVRECHKVGLTGTHDAWTDEKSLQALRELESEGELNFRVCCMLASEEEDTAFLNRQLELGPQRDPESLVQVGMVKMFADGALGSRGAALLEPYSDDPGNTGLLTTNEEQLTEMTRRALRAGFQVCTHAIGDRGNRLVLDAYEAALKDVPVEDHRLRIEHAQIIHPDDIARFAELGIIPSMQPTHATSDMPWAEDRIGAERIKGAYAWRSLLEQECRIPLGSDYPIESHDPRTGIYAAVTRMDHAGFPKNGWYPEHRMTIEEALRGYTVDAAWAAFQENDLGTLEVGNLADVTVLAIDLRQLNSLEILFADVTCVVVGGEVKGSEKSCK